MADYFFKAAAAAVLATVFACFLRRENAEFSALLTVGVCIFAVFLLQGLLRPVVSFFSDLAATAQIDTVWLEPVLKCTGIGILTQIVCAVCRDAGESSLASMVELSGCAAALVLSLPLFTAVLQMILELMGG